MGLLNTVGHLLLNNKNLNFNEGVEAAHGIEERWLITLSAPLSAYNGDFLNSITSGKAIAHLMTGVYEMYGVNDRESFEVVWERTVAQGQQTKFELLLKTNRQTAAFYKDRSIGMKLIDRFVPFLLPAQILKEIDLKYLERETGYNTQELRTKIPNLNMLDSWLDDLEPLFKKMFGFPLSSVNNLLAWDAVRVACLTRWAIELGYIDAKEFEHYAGRLKAAVRQAYNSWAEVSAAYILGGLLWSYSEVRMEELLRTNKMLLQQPDSPFQTITF